MITQEQYDKAFTAYQDGLINERQWVEMCDSVLDQLLEDNKDVFKRLKEI